MRRALMFSAAMLFLQGFGWAQSTFQMHVELEWDCEGDLTFTEISWAAVGSSKVTLVDPADAGKAHKVNGAIHVCNIPSSTHATAVTTVDPVQQNQTVYVWMGPIDGYPEFDTKEAFVHGIIVGGLPGSNGLTFSGCVHAGSCF